jgi:hypothetical protein
MRRLPLVHPASGGVPFFAAELADTISGFDPAADGNFLGVARGLLMLALSMPLGVLTPAFRTSVTIFVKLE